MSRWKRGRTVKVIVRCKRGRMVHENRLHGCGRMFLAFVYKLHKKQGACVTPQNMTRWRTDSRMTPNLLRGTGKSIGGDLDVDDEGSEQRQFEPMQSLHHGSVGYQPMLT
jgi:hypothetical protein